MEEVDEDLEEACERDVLSDDPDDPDDPDDSDDPDDQESDDPDDQEFESGISTHTQEADKVPAVVTDEEPKKRKSKPQDEKVEESETMIIPQRIIDLQRDLQQSVTNVQTAADAKESMQRAELNKAFRLRLEQLENDIRSSQEKFDEITRGWSIAQEKAIPQELQEALNNQQQLCAALIEDKKKLINDLQHELKVGDDRYVKDLRKQAEELDLMMERMEDQIKTLTQAYREELDQIERVYQQESEILLTRDKTEWEQYMKNLLDKELDWLAQRQKCVEGYEDLIYNQMLKATTDQYFSYIKQNEQLQEVETDCQVIKADRTIIGLKQKKQDSDAAIHKVSLGHMKTRIDSLQAVLKKLRTAYTKQDKQFKKKNQDLCAEYEHKMEQYERIQRKIKHFAVADVRKFEEMWLMIEAEVKELVERALVIDSLTCKQLGLAWERPPMAFMELSGPIRPHKQALSPARQAASQSFQTQKALQRSERMMDASVGPRLKTDTESTDMEMYKEETAVQSESGAEVEEGKLPMETVKKVMELLCDEAGFLLEDKLLDLLAPLEKDEQTVVKLSSLLCAFGLEEEDVPRLAHFLMKYSHQQREQTEAVRAESSESSNKAEEVETNSDLIDSNYLMPALKSFLEQLTRSRESSARRHDSFQHLKVRDSSQDEAYWGSMGNVVSEDKLKLWDAAENMLKQYHVVLTEISELVPETQSLEQQNKELRMLLQQSLNSKVGTESEMR